MTIGFWLKTVEDIKSIIIRPSAFFISGFNVC
jgi:hypothetical protein